MFFYNYGGKVEDKLGRIASLTATLIAREGFDVFSLGCTCTGMLNWQ